MPFPPARPDPGTPSTRRHRFPPNLALAAAMLAVACGGGADLLLLPGDGEPVSIRLENDPGSGRVGEPLADSLFFLVSDSRTRPVEGARIVFDLESAPGAVIVPDTAETDANGRTGVRMVLGTTIGTQTGVARVVMPEGAAAPTISFRVTALPENANGIVALSGDNQSAAAGSVLPQPLVVQVTDAFGNPIAGVPIAWAAEGGGSVSETSNQTDGDGRASVQRTLGPTAGTQTTTAVSEGLAGSPVTFTHIATAGSAAGLSIVSGNEQTAQVGTELPGDLVVRLVDAVGNGVPNAAVTWVVGTGGGSVSPQNTLTDEAGRTSSRWTLGPNPGENRVDAVVSGVGVVHFTATGTLARPAGLVLLTQPSGSSRNGEVLDRQPVVQVRDGAGNPAAGVVVTAQLSGGGGELLGTRQLQSDAGGQVAFGNLAIAGAEGPRRLVFTAPGFAGVTSATIVVRSIPTSTTITGDSPDPSVAGGAVTVLFTVAAQGVVPIGTVTVTDGSQSCSGTLTGGAGSCQLMLTAVGTRTLRATYSGSAGLDGSSDMETHQVNPQPAANKPPHADYHWHCDALSCAFTDASTDSDGTVVRWSWDFGDGRTSDQREPTHLYSVPGTYVVALTVTDDDGVSNTATAHVEVDAPPPPPPPTNQAPVAAFSSSCDQLTCSFSSDGSSDSDGRVTGFSWNFGDGSSSNERNPRHTYAAANTYTVTLTVTDDDGAQSAPVSHQVTATPPPPPDNKAPHADFEVHCEFMTCTFEDRSRDDDGSIQSRTWDFGDGSSSTETNPSHTYSEAKKYTVSLTVTDNQGATNTKQRDAEAKAPPPENQPPNPDFNWSCSELNCTFTDASTDDRGISSWSWVFGDPNSGSNTSNAQNPSHSFSDAGSYTVTLTVTDTDGVSRSVSATVQVQVPPPNQPPSPEFTWSCNELNCSFQDGSSDDRGISLWSWDFGDPNSGANTSASQNPNHTFSAGGSYTVTLTTTDSDGESRSISHAVEVTAPNQSPTAAFEAPTSCTTGAVCQFTDASTDPDGSVAEWDWDFDDHGSKSIDQNPQHTYAESGSYNVKLRVKDNRGAQSDEVSHSVTVNDPANAAPVAQIGSIICTGMHCDYTDDSTDANGIETIASYAWVFGDGTSGNGKTTTHDYASAGDYTVTLTVTDDHQASDSAERTVSVGAPGNPGGGTGDLVARVPPS